MAKISPTSMLVFLFTIFLTTYVIQGLNIQVVVPQSPSSARKSHFQDSSEKLVNRKLGRVMIGSTAPTCTYNECRGCKYKCRAEQVPVEGNDPINSPYHYRCICHRQSHG